MVRLSALCTGLLYPQETFLVLISVRGWVNTRGHSAAERIMSMKNSNDTIGNRTRNLLTCSAVPQPTALPRAPTKYQAYCNFNIGKYICSKTTKSASLNLPALHITLYMRLSLECCFRHILPEPSCLSVLHNKLCNLIFIYTVLISVQWMIQDIRTILDWYE